MTPFYRFAARGAIIPFLKMVSRQTVSGLENIPREGGFIAVANHLTDLDSLTAMRALVDADVPRLANPRARAGPPQARRVTAALRDSSLDMKCS